MAKKKTRVKKSKRKVRKAPMRKVKVAKLKMVRSSGRKLGLVIKNLVLFAVLFVLSLVLYMASSDELYVNLFKILAIVFGFVSIAFLIVFLILIFMKIFRK